jgi:hypothetical protein
MVSDVTVNTTVCSLLCLNNAADTVLLNNVRKVGDTVLSRNYCVKIKGKDVFGLKASRYEGIHILYMEL